METSSINRNELTALQYMVAALVETHPDKLRLLAVYNAATEQAINEGLFGNTTDGAIESFTAERARWINKVINSINPKGAGKETPPSL
ncbi:hypothetical protein LMG19282_04227 [Cupriavidus campinensis]|uniref:hypothetical protein n=1 Tax=Cupriavidus campinensis TaxID=151783 RepID=UPI001B01D9A8|nr:hypothetical protein [Cupriavidus campinensis]CAG2152600.1 hypothetical protein LMG19282_04227 [Cupriavidus campinensis]